MGKRNRLYTQTGIQENPVQGTSSSGSLVQDVWEADKRSRRYVQTPSQTDTAGTTEGKRANRFSNEQITGYQTGNWKLPMVGSTDDTDSPAASGGEPGSEQPNYTLNQVSALLQDAAEYQKQVQEIQENALKTREQLKQQMLQENPDFVPDTTIPEETMLQMEIDLAIQRQIPQQLRDRYNEYLQMMDQIQDPWKTALTSVSGTQATSPGSDDTSGAEQSITQQPNNTVEQVSALLLDEAEYQKRVQEIQNNVLKNREQLKQQMLQENPDYKGREQLRQQFMQENPDLVPDTIVTEETMLQMDTDLAIQRQIPQWLRDRHDEYLQMMNQVQGAEKTAQQEEADSEVNSPMTQLEIFEELGNRRLYNSAIEFADDMSESFLGTAGMAIASGVGQFANGLGGWASNYRSTADDLMQTASQRVRENLGPGAGRVLYDLTSTTVNMLPSMAFGALTGGGGLATGIMTGTGAGGNAYREALDQGYSTEQALAYGATTGLLEAGLQSVLGKIAGGAGNLTQRLSQPLYALSKTAAQKGVVKFITESLGEGVEEYLQDILSPVVRNLTLGENNEFQLFSEDALYSGLLGALSGGLFSGVEIMASSVDRVTTRRIGKNVLDNGTFQDVLAQADDSALDSTRDLAAELESQIQQGRPVTEEQAGELANRLFAEEIGEAAIEAQPTSTQESSSTQSNAEIRRLVQDVGRATGRSIELVDSLDNGMNGAYDPQTGILYLSANTRQPLLTVLGHELTHSIEHASLYERLARYVQNSIAFENTLSSLHTDLDTLVDATVGQYAEHGITLDRESALREIYADYIADTFFQDEAAVRQLVQTDRSLGQRIRDFIRRIRTRLTGTAEQVELLRIEQLYRKALRQSEAATSTGDMAASFSLDTDRDDGYTEGNSGGTLRLSPQEYAQLQSARMAKYATYGKAMPPLDYVFAHNQCYFIFNQGLDSFRVISRFDPATQPEIISAKMEEIRHGRNDRSGDGQTVRRGRGYDEGRMYSHLSGVTGESRVAPETADMDALIARAADRESGAGDSRRDLRNDNAAGGRGSQETALRTDYRARRFTPDGRQIKEISRNVGQTEPVSAAASGDLDKSVSREAGAGTGPASHEETFSDTSLPQGENGVNTSIRENASGMQTGVSYAGNDLNRQNSHGILNIKDGGQNGRAQTVDGQAEAGGSAGISGSVIAGIDKGLETGLPPYNGRGDYRSSRIPLSEEVQENLRTKGITPLQLSPAQSAEQFYRDIGRAKQSNPYGAFVEQHSADEYAGMQLFTGENGQVGAAVTGDGNIVSVYKNGDCHSRGAVSSLLLTALQNGGVKLDNFHGKLSQFYLQHGFIPVARTRFVDEFAPTDWNYKRDGRPDIIFWVHNGDTVEQVASRIGTYELLTAWDHVPLFDSYEAAAAYRDAVLRERHAAETGEALRSDSSAFGVNPDTDAPERQNDAKRGFAQGESDTRASIGQGDILREWAERLQRYGPVRPEVEADRQVPAQIDENTRVSRGIGTAMGYSPLVTDEAVPAIQEAVLSGRGTYTAVSDAEALRQARAIIQTKGAESARRSFEEKLIADRRITKTDIAVAELLVQEALSRGEYDTAAQLLGDASVAASQAGQTAQAVALLRKLTPEGRLQTLQRNLDKMNDQFLYRENRATKHAQEILENKEQIANLEDQVHEGTLDRDSAMQRITQLQKEIARLGGGLELSQLQKELILSQTDNAGMEQAVQQVSQQIAQAVPVTGVEKYNAWRFFSMLANPTTHIRNMLGNTSMGLTVMAKDIAAATMEAAADTVAKVVGKDGITRTKSLRAFSPRERARHHDLVEQQYLRLREDLQGDKKAGYLNKFLDDRKIFGDTKLEDVRKFAMDLLEREDGLFLKAHYREAMYQYLTANRVDPNTVSEAQLQRANDYAIQEAQKATFRDASALASWLNRVSRKNKAAEIVIEGNLPFKKTPINILKRGVEYSPLGLVNTVKNAVNMARGKEGYNAARFIDSLASTFTGSALTAIGAWLASQGILTGLLGDDKEDDFKRLQGQQSYALNIGDTSYTIDWLSPDAMPLFVGVEIWNALQEKDEGLTFADATEALSHMLEPMTQMSMLQGLSGTLDSISNSDNKLTAFLSESLTSYLLQMLPTLGGKIGNIIDDTRRQAYIDKNSPLPSDMQYALQQTMKKIPGASTALQPYINEWGEEETEESVLTRILESLISPGYASELDSSEMEQELQRLYDATGETGVLPGRPQKYFTVNGQRVDLTGDAYTQLAKVRGSTQKDILTQLVESDLYLAMDDENRVKAVQRVYDYAAEVAKAEVAEVELSEFAKNAKNAKQKYGLSTAEYILFTQQKSGKKQPEVVKIIDGLPISSKDKDRLYTDIYAESTLDKNSIW